nr:hypothetical protein [Rhodophyticola sp. MJ-SS7]
MAKRFHEVAIKPDADRDFRRGFLGASPFRLHRFAVMDGIRRFE